MRRLLGKEIWIGFAIALMASLIIGMPLLVMTIQSDPCFQFLEHCGERGIAFELTLGAVVTGFFVIWREASVGGPAKTSDRSSRRATF